MSQQEKLHVHLLGKIGAAQRQTAVQPSAQNHNYVKRLVVKSFSDFQIVNQIVTKSLVKSVRMELKVNFCSVVGSKTTPNGRGLTNFEIEKPLKRLRDLT